MDNKRTDILQEIETELASLKEQVLALEEKVDVLRRIPVEEPVEESDFTDFEIGVPDLPEGPAPAPVAEEEAVQLESEPVEMEMVEEDLPEPEVKPEPEPEPEVEPEPEMKPEPEPQPKAVPRPETERLPWRLDKPGISVKNIRSGISLYDRALFIGTLFKEDYALYDRTIGDLNGLSTLDEAVDYLLERFPDWNLKSDIVYNFMMAIRKKLG